MSVGMNFKAAAGRVRGLLAPSKPMDLRTSALTPDRLRDNIMREQEDKSVRYRTEIDQAPELVGSDGEAFQWTAFPDLVRDAARALFGWAEPDLVSPASMRPGHRLNHAVLRAFCESEAFRQMRSHTRNNEVSSTGAAMAAGESLIDLARTLLAEHVQRSEQMDPWQQAQQTAEEMFVALRQRARDEINAVGDVQDPTRRQIKRAAKQLARAREALSDLTGQEAASGYQAAATAAGMAAAEAANDSLDGLKALAGLPGTEPGTPHKLNTDTMIALGEKLRQHEQLMQIVRMLGRILRNFRFKRDARMRNVPQIPVGVTMGSDLRRILPRELARIANPHPVIRAKFVLDYLKGNLLQREMSGYEPAGKGPIIPVVDGSGSMADLKFIWASAVVLAMLSEATRGKRGFACVEFGSDGEMQSWVFAKGEPPDPWRVLDMAGHFFGGGTSIATGLEEALRIMRDEPGFKAADVVLIGDGLCAYTKRDATVLAELRELGVRIHGITILTPNNPYFDTACDWHVDVADLAGANEATDMLAANLA